jgi:hypothetical protein
MFLLLLYLAKMMFCFQQCLVACDETEAKNVEEALVLRDAFSDLPKVSTD